MTISAINRNDAIGNDAVSVYPYGFKIFAATDLEVTVRDTAGLETELVYPTAYSVSGVGLAAGGNVTLANVGAAYQNADGTLKQDYPITIRRVRPLTQATDIRNQGGFFATTHEDTFDNLTMIDQQQQDEIDRSFKIPPSEGGSTATTIAAKEIRANSVLGFDASGNAAVYDPSSAVTEASNVNFLQAGTGAVSRTVQARLRETISVKDFGAVGDGVTDDTAAIQAALDYAYNGGASPARAVFMPSGDYVVSSQLTLRCSLIGEGPPLNSTGSTIKWTGSGNKVFYIPAYVVGWTFQDFRIDTTNVTSDVTMMWFATGLNGAWWRGVEFRAKHLTTSGTLWYKTQTGNFTVGQVVTGGSSGATATISADNDSGASGYLTLTGKTGTFTAGETITDPLGGSALATNYEPTYFNHDGVHVVGGNGAGTKYDCSLNHWENVYFGRCRRGLTFTDPDALASGGEQSFIQCFGLCKEYVFETTGMGNTWLGGDFLAENGGAVWKFTGASGGGNNIIGSNATIVDAAYTGTPNHIYISAGTTSLGHVVNVVGGSFFIQAPTYASHGASDVYIADAGVGSKVSRTTKVSTKDGVASMTAKTFEPRVGIQFPATQNASSDANCLDDYEEGTWTATFATGYTTTPTCTMKYTKVGRLVTLTGDMQVPGAVTANAAALTITGVPFAAANATETSVAPQRANFTTTSIQLIELSGTTLSVVEQAAAGSVRTGITSSAAGNTPTLGRLSLTYTV